MPVTSQSRQEPRGAQAPTREARRALAIATRRRYPIHPSLSTLRRSAELTAAELAPVVGA